MLPQSSCRLEPVTVTLFSIRASADAIWLSAGEQSGWGLI